MTFVEIDQKIEEEVRNKEIAKLNDSHRKNGGERILTNGIQAFKDTAILEKLIENFDTFDETNDPYHEHDFGSVTWDNEKIFWKIDYWNRELTCFEDPLSPTCRRVMTIMLAEEY